MVCSITTYYFLSTFLFYYYIITTHYFKCHYFKIGITSNYYHYYHYYVLLSGATWRCWLWMFGRGKPRLGGLSVAETAVRKNARHEEQVKRAVETRRRRKAAKASSKWSVCVWLMSIPVRTGMYQYVPVCTCDIWNLNFLKLDLILEYLLHWSVTLLQFTLEELPWCMRNIHVLLIVYTCTYYVLVRTFQGILYSHVPVCTGIYQYVPVHTILPDPVQVYRIPDDAVSYDAHLESWHIPYTGISRVILGLEVVIPC